VIELQTLGSIRLDAPAVPTASSVAAQPKRFALLTWLALARPRGPQRRDTLLALFWPETDQERGRQVLRQTLYLLRQSLGRDVIVSRGDEELSIDAAQLSVDADRFEQAIADGRLDEALDLYGGDFLSGFHVPDASPDFEEWVSGERRRLRAMAATAAWTLAAREERAGNATGALYWSRRATGLDRDNEDAVLDLMRLHVRLGDRVGALRLFDEHARRLRRDYEAEPSATLTQLANQLRGPNPASSAPASPLSASPLSASPLSASASVVRRPPAWVAIAIVLLLAAWIPVQRWRARNAHAIPVMAVGSIVEILSPDSSAESAVAADLLATSLARLSGIQVIPEVRLYDVQSQLHDVGATPGLLEAARQAGASQIIRGTIRRQAGAITMDGQIIDLRSGTVISPFRGRGSDLFALVDSVTDQVAQHLGVEPPTAPIRDVTTTSLAAYRLYQEGLRAVYVDGDARAADGLFRAALEEDSTFPMAAYYRFVTANISGLPERDSLMARANRLAERAPDRERLLIRYRIANVTQSRTAMALAETLSVRYPRDLDAMFARASLLQRAGDFDGAARQLRQLIEADSLSLHTRSARCVACDAYVELWWDRVLADSLAAAEATAREALRRQGVRAPMLDLLAVALAREGRSDSALALWSMIYDTLSPAPGGASLQRAWVALRVGNLEAADDTLSHLMRSGAAGLRGDAGWYRAITLRNEGRPAAALHLPGGGGAPAIALFEAGRYREAAAISEALATGAAGSGSGSTPKQLPWQLVHLSTALAGAGDTARLTTIADSVEHVGAQSNFGRDPRIHQYVRGLLWLARGDTARAADAFMRSIWSYTDGYTRANYELARALIALHRPAEAIYPLQAALRGDLQSSNMYVTRTELREQLAKAFALTGQRDSARAEYALVGAAWANAEPAFTARRAVALAYLAR
jgi:DNA-binding SARP family transcriptional activator/TolB-like protein